MTEIGMNSIRKQDLFCLGLYYCQFSRLRNLLFRWRRIPVVRILAFHDVFHNQVRSLRNKLSIVRKVANIVSLDDIVAHRMSWDKINIAITFDDGYRGWIDNVCPILKDLGMSATFFVSSGLLGLGDQEKGDFLRENLRSNRQTTGSLITAEGLRKLADEGFDIGGHTVNHVNLGELSDISKVRSEIESDKVNLEAITGVRVRYFAYPFGIYRNAVIDHALVLQQAGFQGAVTLNPGFNTARTNKYYWHRDLVNASMSPAVFKARLLGNYDGVMYIRKSLRL